jgi:hypothetical protein
MMLFLIAVALLCLSIAGAAGAFTFNSNLDDWMHDIVNAGAWALIIWFLIEVFLTLWNGFTI